MTAEHDPIDIAKHNFVFNRVSLAEELLDMQEKLGSHEHGRLCFSWRRCRKLGSAIVKTANLVELFDAGITGLEEGDVKPAIHVLDTLIPAAEETHFESIIRFRRTGGVPVELALMQSPIFAQEFMIQLRDGLAAFLPPEAEQT